MPFAISKRVSYFLELDLPVFVLGETAMSSAADRVLGRFNIRVPDRLRLPNLRA